MSTLERAARELIDALPGYLDPFTRLKRDALKNNPLKAYPDRDMPSGFSTEGILIEGDAASITRVIRDHHYAHHWDKWGAPAVARLSRAREHFETEVKSPLSGEFSPQVGSHHATLPAAEDSAADIRSFAKREARVVRVTVIREPIE